MAAALALAVGLTAPSASAAPSAPTSAGQARARVAESQASAAAATREYAAAQARLAAIETQLARNSARLDTAIARQELIQRRLGSRAEGMYRRGPFEFIEVLTASVSFDQFSSLWDALVRINRRDARAIQELKLTRAQVASTARGLVKQQTAASVELRRMAAARSQAQHALGQDQAAYRSYLRRIAAIDAQRAAPTSSSAPARTQPRPRPELPTKPLGTGAWKSAGASCYGMGAVGASTASGAVLGPDSMIVAHKTLPFGTLIEFAYNGHRGVATVADRGPYVPGREFDLGPGIARVLGFDGLGTVNYRLVTR